MKIFFILSIGGHPAGFAKSKKFFGINVSYRWSHVPQRNRERRRLALHRFESQLSCKPML